MGKKGDQTKSHILRTASKLFAEKGYKAVTMQMIGLESGLSKGGLYRHYDHKAQVFMELLQSQQQMEAQREETGVLQGRPAGEILDGFLEHTADELRSQEPNLNLALYEFCIENRDGIGPQLLEGQYRKGEDILAALVEYGVSRGELHPPQPRGAVPAVLFLIEGLRMAGEVMPLPRERLDAVFMQIRSILGVQDDEA